MTTDALQPNRDAGAILASLAHFYRATGHKAVVDGGCVWFDGGAFSLMSIPTMLVPDVSLAGVRRLLWRSGKWAAVYRANEAGETTVPLFMLRDKHYDLGHLQRQFRQQVRAAAAALQARECSWQEWRTAAARCDRETLGRRGKDVAGTHPLLTAEGRERIAHAASMVAGLRIHACFCGREIAAYLMHLTLGETCEGLLTHRCDDDGAWPARFASHLLTFSFAQSAMAHPGISAVCVGRQSVPANEPLARFKRHAGFTEEPCRLRIRLHPVLAPLLENRAAAGLLRAIRGRFADGIPVLRNFEVLECSALRGRG